MKILASEYYRNRRGNCAQSIAGAWQQKTSQQSSLLAELSGCGGGGAPGGLCGALYATQRIVSDKQQAENILDQFRLISGGHVTCKELLGKLPCRQCVEIAADLLDKHLP